jgi:energy-coupling factor transport system substrate-specific component
MQATDASSRADEKRKLLVLMLMPLGIALNLAIGTLVHILRLPVYLDAVGTIAITLLIGWRSGVIVGVLSFLIGGVLVNPVLPWFSGTQAAIAIYVHIVARRGGYASYLRATISGLGLGIVAGLVSAPVIVFLFGGITGAGASLVVAFLLATGHSLVKSVVLSGLASEPLDKALQSLLGLWLIRGVPPRLISKFLNGRSLEQQLGGHRSE